MSIAFKPNLKRRFDRVTVPLLIRVGRQSHKATDWSVGGFRVDNYFGALRPGSEFDCTLVWPSSEFSVHLPVHARVARRDKNTLGCSFLQLTPAQESVLLHLVEAALEGRKADRGPIVDLLRSTITKAEPEPVPTAPSSPQAQMWPDLKDQVEPTPIANVRPPERTARAGNLLPRIIFFVVTATTVALLAGVATYFLASRVLPLAPWVPGSLLQ